METLPYIIPALVLVLPNLLGVAWCAHHYKQPDRWWLAGHATVGSCGAIVLFGTAFRWLENGPAYFMIWVLLCSVSRTSIRICLSESGPPGLANHQVVWHITLWHVIVCCAVAESVALLVTGISCGSIYPLAGIVTIHFIWVPLWAFSLRHALAALMAFAIGNISLLIIENRVFIRDLLVLNGQIWLYGLIYCVFGPVSHHFHGRLEPPTEALPTEEQPLERYRPKCTMLGDKDLQERVLRGYQGQAEDIRPDSSAAFNAQVNIEGRSYDLVLRDTRDKTPKECIDVASTDDGIILLCDPQAGFLSITPYIPAVGKKPVLLVSLTDQGTDYSTRSKLLKAGRNMKWDFLAIGASPSQEGVKMILENMMELVLKSRRMNGTIRQSFDHSN